ncbi:MAG: hypothetical protein R6V53_06305 [Candidatus Woesearchaeota archaeon]
MPEREVIVNKKRINYEGLFDSKGVYKIIEDYFDGLNYDKVEKKNIEVVKPEGKYVEILLEPYKKISDYIKVIVKIRMIISDLKEIEIEREKKKVKINQGNLQIIIDGYYETDHQNKWQANPIRYFIRTCFNKYFFKPYTKQGFGNVSNDISGLVTKLQRYLNTFRNF